jgi:F-type H+-transporting ATPase subunit b
MGFLVLASSLTEIRPSLIFWTLITFGILLVLLRWKAWGPILSLVEEREKQISNAIESAKRERAEAEKLLAEQKTAIAEARRDATEMIRRNKAEMDAARDQFIADARKKADEELVTARRQIQDEKAKAVAEIKGMAVDLALNIAERLISEKMDDAKHRRLAEQFIDQLPRPATLPPRTSATGT